MHRSLASCVTIFSLLLTTLTSAAPIENATDEADITITPGTAIIRIDDVLVLNGTHLVFDPLDGDNDILVDVDLQSEYFKNLDREKVMNLYKSANKLGLETRDDDLEKRNGQTCLACMVLQLANQSASTKRQAFEICAADCGTVMFTTIMGNLKQYWPLAGIGAYRSAENVWWVLWRSTPSN
ncbi:hypothetical protein F4778DRAFT_87466 [Xylariomycetidae sp. FL2044]|nr:hypothetical protein F4778DRAFT_87466 [Xylariomycetidae sp. FL2044]